MFKSFGSFKGFRLFNTFRNASLFAIGGAMILVFALLGASGGIREAIFPTSETNDERSTTSTPVSIEVIHKRVLDQLPMPLLKCVTVDSIYVLPPSQVNVYAGVINDASIEVQTTASAKEFEEFYDSWITSNNWNFGTSEGIPSFIWNGNGRLARDKEGNLWIFIPPRPKTNKYQIIFRKSYELLVVRRAEKLDSKYVGFVDTTTFTYYCFQRLLAKKAHYWNVFVEMTKTGTPAGRVYGAILLYKTDPNKARPILNSMLSDNSELQTQGGCMIDTTTVKEEIAQLLKTGKSSIEE